MKPTDLKSLQNQHISDVYPSVPMILVGMGTCGIGNGADAVFFKLKQYIETKQLPYILKKTGCFGYCSEEPLVTVYIPGKPLIVYHRVCGKDIAYIVKDIEKEKPYSSKVLCRIDEWDHLTSHHVFGKAYTEFPLWNEIPFFSGQKKIVLRDAGLINPESITDYIAIGGYQSLAKALSQMKPEEVLNEVKDAKLRGRGGAGFPTATKWAIMQRSTAEKKYIICNADEGDPGAYMNRNEIESDPHMLIEGMIIGAYAMGANEGIAYVRAEYPLAVERLKLAIQQAYDTGILGDNILESGFSFNLNVVEGAGAFVCGEETALIASIEGKAGRPMPRPPYPAEKGLYGCPTNINNVETWCNVPVIIGKGSRWFTQTGTEKSPGTKVFSLVGKVKNTGLVELPLGSPLEKMVFQIGGGTGTSKRVKAVQAGGPSGGCIPLRLFNTPVDYESLTKLGAIMGSGGMVVMDQDNCMVDVARYFLEFSSKESCGKCTPCREGLAQALHILNKICLGEGTHEDLATLETLTRVIRDTALCGLGQTAPNPILTTLQYFRQEYLEHIEEKRCHSGVCEALFIALCENSCPLHMNIPGYIELIKEERLEEAFELTLRDNPLPGTIGRICHFHCQMRCRREMVDKAVSQGEIHRYLADTIYKLGKEQEIYKRLIKEKLPSTGKKIAIVGAGPAGLTAAFYLVRLGHTVTIYDALPEAGGVARFGIPQYRLPKEILAKEVAFIKKLGVKFVFNTKIGTDIPIQNLEEDYNAIYIAIGAGKDLEVKIEGSNAKGVYAGTDFLKKLAQNKYPQTGESVVVVGAGNVAIDVARSVWRMGKDVTLVYRRDKADMPANRSEITEAQNEGVSYQFMKAPNAILSDKSGYVKALRVAEMGRGNIDESGRFRPVPTGHFDEIPCDTVILAIGERVDSDYFRNNNIDSSLDGRIQVNAFTYQTTNPQIYAGGDAVSGPSTAAEAMGMAKKAAEAIDQALMGENRFPLLFRKFDYKNEIPVHTMETLTITTEKIPFEQRRGNFQEVTRGYTGEQALKEVQRCLRCDIKYSSNTQEKKNDDEYHNR